MYQVVVDQWQGSGDIDDALLIQAGVAGAITRLNSMSGGHHMDERFKASWEQSAAFAVRSCYFVYNPWVKGKPNFDWFMANVPSDMTRRIFLDVEVKYANYSPLEYANQVSDCCKRLKDSGFIPTIYTGGWFLSLLSFWPTDLDYWWARYPYSLYPSSAIQLPWGEIMTRLQALPWSPSGTQATPGPAKLWQCSGDRIIPPGCGGHPLDLSIFNGTLSELKAWFACDAIAPAPALTLEEKVEILWKNHPELHPS